MATPDSESLLDEGHRRLLTGDLDGAFRFLCGSLAVSPRNHGALKLISILLAQSGHLSNAATLMARAIRINPNDAVSHQDFANMLSGLGLFESALRHYDESIQLDQRHSIAAYNKGNLLRDMGKEREAIQSYNLALARNPQEHLAALNKGLLLTATGQAPEAMATHRRTLVLIPAEKDHWHALASAAEKSGLKPQAILALEHTRSIDPRFNRAYINLGNLLSEPDSHRAALMSICALVLSPSEAGGYVNLGISLHDQNEFRTAISHYDRAILLAKKQSSEAYLNRGNALRELEFFDEAIASYEKAIALQPDLAEAHWNQSTLWLLLGQLIEGFEHHHWRFLLKEGKDERRQYAPPLVSVHDISGQSVLIYPEQGYGDTIQFSRYAILLAETGARVFLEVQPPLKRLLASIDPRITVIGSDEPTPSTDWICPLLDLPHLFQTSLETIPSRLPYLQSPKRPGEGSDSSLIRQEAGIGVVWSGNPGHKNDDRRSIPFDVFSKILRPDLNFVALQKGLRQQDKRKLAQFPKVFISEDQITDFADAAELIDALDLVITVDTATAHLAGALGKETWLLLPFMPDFRWLLGRSDSPWYPSVTLYRQDQRRNWGCVLNRVIQDLNDRYPSGFRKI